MTTFIDVAAQVEEGIRAVAKACPAGLKQVIMATDEAPQYEEYPYAIITRHARRRLTEDATSDPADQTWRIQYKVLVMAQQVVLGDDRRVQNACVDILEDALAAQAARSFDPTKWFGHPELVTGIVTQDVAYGDITVEDAQQQRVARVTGGEFDLFVTVNYQRE